MTRDEAIDILAREAIERALDVTTLAHWLQRRIPATMWPEVERRAYQIVDDMLPDAYIVIDAYTTLEKGRS